ncbi:MAG: DNA-3-methyladenine glycosylase 2 family protein [Cyanobacteria bacterium P01_D01_bin.115]
MNAASEIHDRFITIAHDLSPVLAEAIARTDPIALLPHQDAPLAERLCRAVAGQQLSIKAAASIWGRVVERANGKALIEHFATTDPQTLRDCGLSRAKAKALGAIATAALAGELDAEVLRGLGTSNRTQRLIQIWGVGQWTADMINLFYFGDPDIWPDGDTTARKMLERLTSTRRKTTRTAARFAPYRSYLALYMWRQADAAPE